jgi:hypothetical protein
MTRNFAFTSAVIVQRIVENVLLRIYQVDGAAGITPWIAISINFVVAEIYINWSRFDITFVLYLLNHRAYKIPPKIINDPS